MSGAKLVVRQLGAFKKELLKADNSRKKSGETAARVEVFRLGKVLRKEITAGAPGGRLFRPLTVMAKRSHGRVNRSPLRVLAKGVRYQSKRVGKLTVLSVGFTDNTKAVWRRIATRQQEGFEQQITPKMYRYFGHRGDDLGGRKTSKVSGLSRFFNLKKSTTSLKTEKRPIIEPFWAAHKRETERNVLVNFQRKMRGERI